MKKVGAFFRNRKFLIPFIIGILFLSFSFRVNVDGTFSTSFKDYFSTHSKKLLSEVLILLRETEKRNPNIDSAKLFLRRARAEYKSIEPFVITFLPGDARILNKVIIFEMEEDDEVSAYVTPHGFQYIEKLLYSDSVFYFKGQIKDEVEILYSLIEKFKESISYLEIYDRDVFESMQMHLVRQFMLGFANFETANSRTGLLESAATISFYKELLQKIFNKLEPDKVGVFNKLYTSIDSALQFIGAINPGSEPDYFNFYKENFNAFSEQLSLVRKSVVSNNFYNTIAVNYQAPSVFYPSAFNSFFFVHSEQFISREAVINLGRTLFFDPALSANNLRACASCHKAEKAFTDGLALSQAFEPGKSLNRNAPTVINSVLQRRLFHDGRVASFEDQAGLVMSNALEMHSDFGKVAVKLKNSQEYVQLFRQAFAVSADTVISSGSILTAIAEYERSLIGLNSRFDQTISKRDNQMNNDEKEGFNIFMGKANCASCHFIPLFNGILPPEYVDTEWEIIGVPSGVNAKHELDPDVGRAGVVNVEIFKHAFKIPTLRNIELTGPYMHNGVFRTLEEVIEFYDIGGGIGLGYDVPFQTLSSDSLHLTATEKFQLISFLKTLTDTANLSSKPSKLPFFTGDAKLNLRPVGGEY